MSQIPRVVLGGLRGGSGKTILTVALISGLRKRGINTVPFKKGPDYIDAGWLAYAAGHPCYNLDLFIMDKRAVLRSFLFHSRASQCAVIEGNRGLYDGVDMEGTFSTAELAKLIYSPVLLVIDSCKTTRTAAAMITGCQKFDPDVDIRGVILNCVAGNRHESLLRSTIEHYCGLPVVGAVPRLKEKTFPERHMGLTPYQEHPQVEKAMASMTEIAEKYLDLNGIWKIANEAPTLSNVECGMWNMDFNSEIHPFPNPPPSRGKAGVGERLRTLNSELTVDSSLKIGVIRDSAFQFYYPENFEELEKRGAKLVEISALIEKELPELDALYIGGGFPETHAITLAGNDNFRDSLRQAVEKGLPVYAECGGLMYLGESLVVEDKTYPMAGILPVVFGLEKRPQAHGYSVVEVEKSNPYFAVGRTLKGHEFHYSRVLNCQEDEINTVFRMKRGNGLDGKRDGIVYKNVLATYTHMHALGTREWTDGVINRALSYREKRENLKVESWKKKVKRK
ncbi:MAG: cobyrinate a,c-diamide synthase [Nitrospirota bacterium]